MQELEISPVRSCAGYYSIIHKKKMYKLKSGKLLILLLILSSVTTGCDSEVPDLEDAGEKELITNVTISLSPEGGGQDIIAVANDPNGDGAGFVIDNIELTSNTSYMGTITVRDDVNGEDITAEIEEEGDEHQFWYTPAGDAASRLTVTITDMDANGLPVGLEFTVAVSAGGAETGTLNVILSHYDDAPKDGVTRSDESDIDLIFLVNITS